MACFRGRAPGRTTWLATLVWMLVGWSASLAAEDKLQPRVEALLGEPHFKHAHWGLLFVDLQSGEVVLERNRDKLFAPASVTKLFSTAAALDALGADHRFVTPVHRRGELTQGVLDGDLILVASGDPSLGGRTTENGEIAFVDDDHIYANWSGNAELTPQDPLAGIQALARQVAAAGIRKVNDVYIDDRLFDHTEGSGSGPSTITPIMVNDNLLDFTFEPTEPGQPVKAQWRPQTSWFKVELDVQTVREDEPLEITIERPHPQRYVVRGKLPANRKKVVRVAEVPDAKAFARAVFVEALEAAGVEVVAEVGATHRHGALPASQEYAALPKVAEFTSPPFSESARLVLKVSHNLHASTLPLLVAVKHGKRDVAAGLKAEGEFLARAGIDLRTISFGGGAGGSRADYVTPTATVELLKHMAGRPDFAAYERALPILGVDGTLAKSVGPESPARGKVQAKTGTLVWDNLLVGRGLCTSKALGGYLTTAQGKRLAFAAFVNGVPLNDGLEAKKIGADLGRLCEIVHDER